MSTHTGVLGGGLCDRDYSTRVLGQEISFALNTKWLKTVEENLNRYRRISCHDLEGGGGGGETVLRNAFQSNHAAVKVVPKIARVFSVELGVIVFFDCEMCWHPFSNLLISPFPGSLCWFTAETFAFLRKQRRLRFARVATLPSPPYNTSFSKWRPQDVHKLYTKDYAIRWWPLGGSIYIQQSHFILTFGGSLLTELYGKKVMKVIKLLIRNPFQFSARWI